MNLSTALAVAGGGALGALARYALVALTARPPGAFPVGHFVANVAGSLLIGVLFVLFSARADSDLARFFLITGVLGAFTTYSAFSLDTLLLVQRGAFGTAALYVLCTVAACLGGCALGVLVARAAIS